MTRFLPFPPELALRSAQNARTVFRSRRSLAPRSHVTTDVAAYRLPNGVLRPAYDLYRPEYPEGAMPGIGDLQHDLRHYPNGTQGCEPPQV